jgi:hypothetical protein
MNDVEGGGTHEGEGGLRSASICEMVKRCDVGRGKLIVWGEVEKDDDESATTTGCFSCDGRYEMVRKEKLGGAIKAAWHGGRSNLNVGRLPREDCCWHERVTRSLTAWRE